MKKIIITEDQAKRLNLINEDINPLSQYEQFCKVRVEEVNKLYSRVTSISIGEILNNDVNMEQMNGLLDKIENDMRAGNKRAYDYINNLPESDLDIRIDRAYDTVNDKLTALQLIVMDLEKLQLSTEQHNLLKSFSDVKPLDINDI